MRSIILATALASVASPAAAQVTPVVTRQKMQDTTAVRVVFGQVSPAQLRALQARLTGIVGYQRKLEAQLVEGVKTSTMSLQRQDALQEEMGRAFIEVLSIQHQLALGCSLQRPKAELVDGTLGLHVHDSVPIRRTFDQQGGGTLTMFFRSTPLVAAVDPGSPAEKAGIRVGDVWVAANNRMLIDSVRFDEMLKPGAVVTARIIRDGKEIPVKPMTVVRKLSEFPAGLCDSVKQFDISTPFMGPGAGVIAMSPSRKPVDRSSMPVLPAPGGANIQIFIYATPKMVQFGGATLQLLDDEWRSFSGLEGDGLLITDLSAGSPADAAGLHKGELIRTVNGEAVATTDAFRRAIGLQPLKLVFMVYNKKTGTRSVVLASGR